jgi:glycosyltransferase involved in cell wall biosynthesis
MDAKKVLIYEPSVEGHHVGWLRFITEDLLGAGLPLTLALDTRREAMERIRGQMGELLPRVEVIPAFSPEGARARANSPDSVAACLEESGAALAFLAHFNDIASAMLRRAALGMMPDERLRGRLGGIYFRPLFLRASVFSPNQAMKKAGFRRLIKNGWLNPVLMVESLLCDIAKKKYPGAPIHLLADPYPENFHADRAASRRQFNLPDGKFVMLFYGGGYKRKGLHLVARAMLNMSTSGRAFLLCAGVQPDDAGLARDLEKLRSQGRAEIVNRYVSAEEEKQLFAACDMVLLPYIRHPVSSAVLSRAAGAGKPVLASDEYLIGHVVRQFDMGMVFPTGNVPALQQAIEHAASASSEELAKWQAGAQVCAKSCSRDVFRSQLVAAVESAFQSSALSQK